MAKVLLEMSMSLVGYATGPDVTPEEPWSCTAETIVKAGGTTYTFVTSGIDDALGQARAAARSADVIVIGGGEIARQYLLATDRGHEYAASDPPDVRIGRRRPMSPQARRSRIDRDHL